MITTLPAIVIKDGDGEFRPTRYNEMRAAIARAAAVDECHELQSRATAMQAYYAQVHDDEAWDTMREIKLRAWRRMSEIVASVDVSKCARQKDMIEKVRSTLGADGTAMLSDSRIIELIRLSGVPEAGFEAAVSNKRTTSVGAVIAQAHPDAIRRRQEDEAKQRDSRRRYEERRAEEEEAAKVSAKERAKAEKELIKKLEDHVKREGIVDANEVGLTLTADAADHLVKFTIMMDKKMHDQLRDAAHERRVTMWSILREATNYWFVVNGYEKV
jgi:hypothetical protein